MAKKTEKPIDYSKPLKNAKYERFCQEYMIDSNGAQAAIRAGYSKKTANVKGSQLLTIVSIKNRLGYLRGKLEEKTDITVQSVIDGIIDTQKRAKGEDNFNAELKAADMLMKYTGGYEKDNEQKGLTVTDIMAITAGK
jgi:phage terminase small subunit